jgi:hypothetical protein
MNLDDFRNSDEYIDAEDMRGAVRQAFAQGDENKFFRQMLRRFRDPVKPEGERGRWRLHPLLLIGGVLLLAAAAIFLYITFSN